MNNQDYRALALGAWFEALVEVDAAAAGRGDRNIDHLLAPLFTANARSLAEVFPQPSLHRAGVEALRGIIGGDGRHRRVIRYGAWVMNTTVSLQRNRQATTHLGKLLDALNGSAINMELLLALEEIYVETISRLGKRLQIVGNAQALKQPLVAARIRALLLAAIRFAWLWHQLGGRRWHLLFLFKRGRLWQDLNALRERLT